MDFVTLDDDLPPSIIITGETPSPSGNFIPGSFGGLGGLSTVYFNPHVPPPLPDVVPLQVMAAASSTMSIPSPPVLAATTGCIQMPVLDIRNAQGW